MLKVLTRRDATNPLFDQMFRARAIVLRDRLGWSLNVVDGMEIDYYDTQADPIYLVTLDDCGFSTGSLRLLRANGQCMLDNEFRDFFDPPVEIQSPLAWECTRFCVHPTVPPGAAHAVAVELLAGLCDLALRSRIDRIVGVYDAAMSRVYRRIGWSPVVLARSRAEVGHLYAGRWMVSPQVSHDLQQRVRKAQLARGDALSNRPVPDDRPALGGLTP
ncbi:acyl-homoserine-lactone synthase [Rhodopseudomonas palustris]|uniref:Autoinducer synthesis protein n=1 Tax=Rhodopseudomonas palustris (strain BisB18) TaxID=316056 RepID=Q216V2_RHOPB